MFDKDKRLTSLDIGSPAPRQAPPHLPPAPASATKVDVKPQAAPACLVQAQTLEGSLAHFTGARRKFEEMTKTGLKPQILFYIVFPQPGLTHSLTSSDGSRTVVPIFNAKAMAEAYLSTKKLGAVAAACSLDNLSSQADHWISSGLNSYALNICCKCLSLNLFPISELQSEELFLSTWRLDLANRRQFAESYGRTAAAVLATNPKQARAWLEGVRDHIDAANPYLHWVIAVLAGMAGDMDANAASIKRLDAFGPPFTGKLQGTSFDPSVPGSQITTMSEALLGLGLSLGYVDLNKIQQKQQKE